MKDFLSPPENSTDIWWVKSEVQVLKEKNSDRVSKSLEVENSWPVSRDKDSLDVKVLRQSEKIEDSNIKESLVSEKKSLEFLPVPANFSDKLEKGLVFSFLRKFSPVTLEKLGLQSVVWAIGIPIVFAILNYWAAPVFAAFESYGLRDFLHSFVSYNKTTWYVFMNDVFLGSSLLLAFLWSTGMFILKKWYTLDVGKHGKIILDPTNHTIHFHSQRLVREMRTLFAVSADIKAIIKEVIYELYASGRIVDFNILKLESYLLVHDDSYRRFLRDIAEYLPPGAQIVEMPVRPLGLSTKWTIRFIKAGSWQSFVPFLKKKNSKKMESDSTRGIQIILPKEKSSDNI